MAVTPNRSVWLEVDGPEYSTVLRPTWQQNWGATEIGKADGWVAKAGIDGSLANAPGHVNTMYVPGDAWVLRPIGGDKFLAATGQFEAVPIPPSGFTVAPNIRGFTPYRPPTDLPGAGGEDLVDVPPALRRQVPADQDWDDPDNMLIDDETDYPPPVDPDYPPELPVDRILYSNDTFEANQAFSITFGVQHGMYGSPMLLRFYFGGPTPTVPAGTHGGTFCLELFGNGKAILYERQETTAVPPVPVWTRRLIFNWAAANTVQSGSHTLMIWPMARDRILFYTSISDQPSGPQGLILPPVAMGRQNDPVVTLYRDTPGQTGHMHQDAATGPGPVRLDLARTNRMPIIIWQVKFPPTGSVTDQPFMIPHALDAGTPMEVYVDGYARGTGCQCAVWLYNAATGAALTKDLSGRFLAHQGQQNYWATFDFTASTNQNQTPVLFGYQVHIAGDIVVRTKPPGSYPTGKIRDGSITGPDLMPGHGSANVNIRDRNGIFTILRAHDRRYARVIVKVPTTGPSGDPRGFVVIHEGETWQPKAILRGREGMGNTQWFDYSLNMIDMWYRLEKQRAYQIVSYAQDFSAPMPPPALGDVATTVQYLPWKILNVIRDLIHRAGFPHDEIDCPGEADIDALRLPWGPGMTPNDYVLQPGDVLAKGIHRLAFDFLGRIVVRDPNAYNDTNENRGLWRVLSPPVPTEPVSPPGEATYPLANSKAEFYVRRPAGMESGDPFVVEDEGAFGAMATYIKDESYVLWPQAPEGTSLWVTGRGTLNPAGSGDQKLGVWTFNKKCVDWSDDHPTADPDSISFMDRWEGLYINDPMLITPDACGYVAARIARQALNGRLWCEFTAPLLFIQDPADPLLEGRRRPLRVYDQVTVVDEHGNPHPVMLRNVNPFWTGARIQWAHHQGLFLDAR